MSELPPEVPDFIRSAIIIDPRDIWGNLVSRGLGDVVAALTPAYRYDGRGSIVFLDSFEDGLAGFATVLTGTGAAVTLTSAEKHFGGFSCKMTGGSTSSRIAQLRKDIPLPPLSKVGLEFHFRLGDNVEYVTAWIDYYDGVDEHVGGIRYDVVNEKYQYYNSAASWTDLLTNVKQGSVANFFYAVKFVFDPEDDFYVRALLYGQEADMSSYASETEANATDPRIRIDIRVTSTAGQNGWIYIDSIIITQNEPA